MSVLDQFHAFQITQSTSQMFRDLYVQNTLLVLVESGFKRVHNASCDDMTVMPGQLLVFPSSTFITIENRTPSGNDYVASCLSYPDELVASVFPQDMTNPDRPSAIHIDQCPAGLSEAITAIDSCTPQLGEPEAVTMHRLVTPLVWLRSMGTQLAIAQKKMLDCRVRDLVGSDVSKKWRSAEIAKTLGMSEATLRRKLREHSTTFSDLVMGVRLETALTLLQSTTTPVSRIGMDCGFATPSHFASAFKARFGIAPSFFRQKPQ